MLELEPCRLTVQGCVKQFDWTVIVNSLCCLMMSRALIDSVDIEPLVQCRTVVSKNRIDSESDNVLNSSTGLFRLSVIAD